MTIAEINYTQYVSSFVGIPYKWNSEDPEKGLDCWTLTMTFLQGLGYDISGNDGSPIPTEKQMEKTLKHKQKKLKLTGRYLKGIIRQGKVVRFKEPSAVSLSNCIKKNDVVAYKTAELPHLGVYVGGDRLLTASRKYGGLLLKLSMLKTAIITIVRIKRRPACWTARETCSGRL